MGVSFKICARCVIPRHAQFICDPSFFWSQPTQDLLSEHIKGTDRQWIYNLTSSAQEEIFIETSEWILAKDKHPGTDLRFLIVYRDLGLRSIRDLRYEHVPMLLESRSRSLNYIRRNFPKRQNWYIYFHYYPSVFQLHAHIAGGTSNRNQDRMHHMHNVVRNLMKDSEWYKNALILTRCTRFVHQLRPCLDCDYGIRDAMKDGFKDATGNPTLPPAEAGDSNQHQYLFDATTCVPAQGPSEYSIASRQESRHEDEAQHEDGSLHEDSMATDHDTAC